MLSDHERLILLNLVPDVGSLRFKRLLEAFGDLDGLWKASPQALRQVAGIGSLLAGRIAAGRRNERLLGEEVGRARRAGVSLVTLADAEYPKALREIHDPPLALYVRGTLPGHEDVVVAMVGSRRPSFDGLQIAERFAAELAGCGVTVVSGLARGIDGAAHRGALKAQGRTLAVLGNGLSRIYPPEHAALAEQIAEQGAMISEYPMTMAPLAQNFPRRNRLISGLSRGVVIVEAARRSGALITADCALEQGREVFAVPGPVTRMTSQGTHHLLKQGACLVTSVDDILEELQLSPQPVSSPTVWRWSPTGKPVVPSVSARGAESHHLTDGRARGPQVVGSRPDASLRVEAGGRDGRREPLAEPEQRIFSCLSEHEPRHIDVIAGEAGLAADEVSARLLHMELKQVVRQLPGKQFIKYG